MRCYGFKFIVAILAFLFASSICAEQKKACDTCDAHLSAKEGNNASYNGVFKINKKEGTKLILVENKYCPPCHLKNKALCDQRPCQKYNIIPSKVYKDIQVEQDVWMKMANEEALHSVEHGGGPFGAVIVQIDDVSGRVIRYWTNHNHVTEWKDPTAHAEIAVIRVAAKELNVVDLGHIHKNQSKLSQPSEWSHCVLYSSAESCPMCLAAAYWAGIKELAFGATRYDAAAPGVNFSDKMIYQELSLPYAKRKRMHVVHSHNGNSLDAFNYYKRNEVVRYGEDKIA